MTKSLADPSDPTQQLQNLRIFISVAESKSIARASDVVFKTPSVITRSVLDLEQCLGVSLFERKPRGMLLNAYGEAALVRARRIQREIDTAAAEFVASHDKASAPSSTTVMNLLFDSRKLHLLVHLADLRNVSAAAAHMGLSQAGASMALSRVEAALGRPLFQRMMQGMVPTDETQQLLVHVKRVFAELRHMSSDISSISGNLTGTVIIGTTPVGRTHFFPEGIAAAVSANPGVHLLTVEGSYEELVGRLRSGEVDVLFGILRPPELCHGLITEPLFHDSLSVVARAGHPLASRANLTTADVHEQRWIMPRNHSLARPWVDKAFRDRGLEPPEPVVETGDLSILRELLLASDMVAVTSPHQVMLELRSGTLVALHSLLSEPTRDVGLVLRDGAMLPPAALAVIDAVRDRARRG